MSDYGPGTRVAFLLGLKPHALHEYVQHHLTLPELWPDLAKEIEWAGIATITIFEIDPEHLVLVSEVSDVNAWERFWASDAFRRWDVLMQPLMRYDADGRVAATPITEIWRFEFDRGSDGGPRRRARDRGRHTPARGAVREPPEGTQAG